LKSDDARNKGLVIRAEKEGEGWMDDEQMRWQDEWLNLRSLLGDDHNILNQQGFWWWEGMVMVMMMTMGGIWQPEAPSPLIEVP
jgi:hypothetical protein